MKINVPKENISARNFQISFNAIKKIILLSVFTLTCLTAQAQITAGFELEGNATAVLPNPPDDWDLVYNGTSSAQVTSNVVTDANNIFMGGGSKDDLDINNWGWTTGSVPDKDDILHGGVALYNNCRLYFFADRYATNGSANIGFWLFKNNVSVNSGGTFSGVHSIGDLLIVSEFVNGGGTAIIKAYKWVGSGGNTNGTLDSVPVTGVTSFAITNTSSVPSPWPFVPKTGPVNQFGAGAFFEGGIDLCSIPGLDPCFTSFLIETRSSFAVNATLKDFLNGSFTSSPQVSLAGGSRCAGGAAVVLSPVVSGGILPYAYSWSPGGSTASSISVSPSVTTTYTVTVTGLNGCARTATATVTVNPQPNVNAGPDKILNCLITSVQLSGSSSTSGASFSWSTIGGNIVSGGATATPTVNAAGTYILTVTSSAGCTASDTTLVSFNGTPPNVNAGSNKTLTCLVTSVILNGSSSTGGASFSWTTTDGNIVSGGSTATPTVNAAGTYILTVTDPGNGCSASDTVVVNLNNTLPDVHAGADKTLNCTIASVILNGSSSTPGATFSWTTDGNIVSGGSTATPTVNAAGVYILTVTHPSSGCIAKDTAMVLLNNTLPDADAGADTLINCYALAIALNGSSATSGVIYSWTTVGGNIVSGAGTANPIVNSGGMYVLTVTDTANTCMASDSVNVTMDVTPPDANAGPDKTLTCTATSVSLDGSSGTPGATFSWTATNGGVILSGANTATPVVQIPGTYILTVTDTLNGCTAQDSADVFQDISAPNVNGGADMVITCVTTSVVLNGSTSTGSTIYSWTTADGNIVSGATTLNPTVNAAGTYMLTVTNTINGCQASDVTVVTLNTTAPDVNAGTDMTLNCSILSLSLNGSSSTAGVTFSWTTSGGSFVSGSNTANPVVNAAGLYILTVTDTVNGCTAMDTAQVFLDNTLPDADAGADTVINCLYPSLVLNGSSLTPSVTFAWSTAGGNIVSGGSTANPLVDAGGMYVLTVTDTLNGCMAADTVIVMMNISPPDVNAGPDTTLTCAVTQATLNGSSSLAGAVFSWTAAGGGVIFSGASTANPVVQIPGTYILTVTDPSNGCSASDTAIVYQDIATPNANAGSDMTLTCADTLLTLNGSTSTGTAIFSWSTGDGNIVSGGSTLNPAVNAPGTYVLTVTNTVNGCTAQDSVNVSTDLTAPDVFAGANEILTCLINSALLNGSSLTPGVTFSWTTPDGNIVLGAGTPTPTVDASGSYILTVTDTANGCSASDTAEVLLDNFSPDVDAGDDTVINCLNTSIVLQGSSVTSGVTYSWTTPDGNIVSGAATANATVNAGGTYVLTVTDIVNGCSDADSVLVLMDMTVPDADAGPDTTLTCVVTQVILSGSSATAGAVFSWTAAGGGVILSGANTATPLVQIPGTYILTVTDPVNGCTATDSAEVFYDNTMPDVDAGGDMLLNCALTSTTLNGFSSTAGATAQWNAFAGGNIVSGAATFDPTVDIAGMYVLTVTHPFSGCTAQDTAMVTLNVSVPDADAGADAIIGCGTDTVILHGSSAASVGYNWTTIGGNIVSGANTADPVVDAAGIYVLTVVDHISGCSATDTVILNLSIPPVVDLGDDTAAVFCEGHITLDAGNPGMDHLWSTGDTTQTIDVSVSGTYFVTVTNSYGCEGYDTINVTITPGTFDINLGNDTTFMNCHAPPFILDLGMPGATYVWSNGSISASVEIDSSGTYYVTVTDSIGCVASDTITITIIDNNIDVDFGPDTTLCSCIVLSAYHPLSNYSWCSGETYPFITVCESGQYCVTVSNGTCIDSDTINITINPPPVVDLGNDTVVTSGSLLLDAGNPGSAYLWSTGETTQTITVSISGEYSVTVTDSSGCTAADTIDVDIMISIGENNGGEEQLNVYPNPIHDNSFTLSFGLKESSDVEIRVLNMLGRTIYAEKIEGSAGRVRQRISLNEVAKGMYFAEVLIGKKKKIAKIIIE